MSDNYFVREFLKEFAEDRFDTSLEVKISDGKIDITELESFFLMVEESLAREISEASFEDGRSVGFDDGYESAYNEDYEKVNREISRIITEIKSIDTLDKDRIIDLIESLEM